MRENGKTWYRICKMLCEYKKYFPGIICCLLGSSFITFIHPLLIRQITDCGILQKNMKYILLFSVILIIISLTQQELNIIQTKLFSNVHNQFTHSLYKKTYWKINRMKIQYFAERGSAEIINTIGMDIDNVSSVVDQITQFSISSILQIIGGVVGLSLLDWKLAILIEAIIPLKFIIVSYCANKKREVFEQWIEDKRKFMSWFAECINGIHEMKLWNLFQVKKSQFEGLQKDLMDSYKKNAMLDEYSTVSVVVIDTVVNALLYILSGLFIIKGEFTIGGAFAFITYSAYVVNPISALINIKYYFAQIEPSAKRLFELWGQPEELEMKLCEMKPEKIYQDRDMVFEVKNLVFGYEPGHPILNGISLCVKKGERIAIVGENGSGKSTLLNLLAGFYRPQKGIIKLYGAPVELMDIQDMRNRIAVISQRPYTVDVPLVLHGGSGLTDNDFKRAIQEGISKINIFTDINVAAVEAEFRKFESMNKGIIDLIPAAVEAVKQETMKKMILFSSNGKGVLDQPSQDELVKAVVQGVLKEIVGK